MQPAVGGGLEVGQTMHGFAGPCKQLGFSLREMLHSYFEWRSNLLWSTFERIIGWCVPLYYWGKSKSNSRDPWEPAASTWARLAGGVDSRGRASGEKGARIPAIFCVYGQGGFCNGERSIRDCPKALGFSNCEKGDTYSWDNKG